MNERFAPELLENRSNIVDCMLEQVHEMEENIRRAKKGDFKVSIHKMEVNSHRLSHKAIQTDLSDFNISNHIVITF